jgi:hypothetical protein
MDLHLESIGLDPAGHRAGGRTDGVGGADRGGPGRPEHRIGPVDQGRDLLELLGTDLVAQRIPPLGLGSIL